MDPSHARAIRYLAALLALAPAVEAQQLAPHAGYVYPAGGRQGSSFEVTVGGQFLDGAAQVYVSGGGAQATVNEHVKPLTPAQFNKLREQLKELIGKKPATAEDKKLLAETRQKLATSVRRPANPAIAEIVTLRVTIADDAAPGERELRLGTRNGLTNPLVFCVGQLPEFSKKAAKVIGQPGIGAAARLRNQPRSTAPVAPANITLPAIVNGQIMPGGVDRYRFPAPKGQHLVVTASARKLIPYISDAVPGWFQATVALYDAQGKEVGYADDYRFHPDPVLYCEIPSDGEYVVEIKDAIYRGREDFVYRIAIGELPFVTSIFPLGGKAGVRTSVAVKGWNLPVARITPESKGSEVGICPISVRKGEWISNRLPFAVDTLPERTEEEPNNLIKAAQRVKLPVVVNGRIDRPGDADVFRFEGRAGEEIVAEVFARRLDSPLDSLLKLTDSTGKQLAANDDHDDKGAGLTTHQADSRISARLPKNGTYYLHLIDTQRKGGAEYSYRLRVSRPRPDFELRVTPSSVNVRAGTTVPITVYALRKDGFAGDITLRLKDAPPGFTLSGSWIPAGQDKVRLTLTAPPAGMDAPVHLNLEGCGVISGRQTCRPGVPAEDMTQAFAYHHLVPAKEWMVRVIPSGRRAPWKLLLDKLVKLPAGGTATVRLVGPRGPWANQILLALSDPPEGIAIQDVSPVRGGVAIRLGTDAGKVQPGLKGNLIVDAFLERTVNSKDGNRRIRRQPLGVLPAIPYEIVRP
jgi:hypothetical protein